MDQPQEIVITQPTDDWTKDFISERLHLLKNDEHTIEFTTERLSILLDWCYDSLDNMLERESEPDITLQLLTGQRKFLDHYLFDKNKYKDRMLQGAGCSGLPDSIHWLFENNILEEEHEKEYLADYIIYSKSTSALKTAFDKGLIALDRSIFHPLIKAQWKEGFIWFNTQYPQILFKLPEIPEWYAEQIFEIFTTDMIGMPMPQSPLGIQWLTGDVSLYKKKDYTEEMILCAVRTGNPLIFECLENWGVVQSFAKKKIKRDVLLGKIIFDEELHHLQFPEHIAYSKNTATFDWVLKWQLLDNWWTIFLRAAHMDWTEGMLWIMNQIPHILKENKFDRVLLLLAKLTSCEVWDWCKEKEPALFTDHNSHGYTFAHELALEKNMIGLRWCKENIPSLLDVSTNKNEENILHVGAVLKNIEIVQFGYSHNKELALKINKQGANLAVYALHGGDLDLVHLALQYLGNPVTLHIPLQYLDEPVKLHISRPYFDKRHIQHLENEALLSRLNKVLNTNKQLEEVVFLGGGPEDLDSELQMQIKQKLARNRLAKLFFPLQAGFWQTNSILAQFPQEILGLFINTLFNVLYQNISFKPPNHAFFKTDSERLPLTDEYSCLDERSSSCRVIQK